MFRTLNRTPLVTTNYVIAETLTWFAQSRLQILSPRFRDMVDTGRRTNFLQVVWITEPVHMEAWDIFDLNPDRRFSLTDCASFVVCKREAVDFVFSFDSDFRAMGFDVRP